MKSNPLLYWSFRVLSVLVFGIVVLLILFDIEDKFNQFLLPIVCAPLIFPLIVSFILRNTLSHIILFCGMFSYGLAQVYFMFYNVTKGSDIISSIILLILISIIALPVMVVTGVIAINTAISEKNEKPFLEQEIPPPLQHYPDKID